jgi:hypothetical protein
MSPEAYRLLTCQHLPATLTTDQASILSGFAEHSLPILASAKILVPLNDYGGNTVKVYFTEDVLDLRSNRNRVLKAVRHVYDHWRHLNELKKKKKGNLGDGGTPPPAV